MAILQKDTLIRLVQPVIQGHVVEAVIVDGAVQYRVKFTDATGQEQERFFREDEIEVVA